ncbi:ABC transporter permease [Actinoplanes solisilvae]|uniref:ABC transporter permease n=1 Tax=Actinoplanes solisilvae TaxID=2486853 RepID=UPI000FDB23DB|nr:ABC transporter permease [Actinoplanes solisilvae]
MLRLIVSDLTANARVWLGALLIAAAAATVGAMVASDIETALSAGGTTALALYGISGTIAALTVITALIVVGTVTTLTVTLQQRAYALWQLIGLTPARIRLIVTTQLLAVSLLGAVLGCAAALPILQPLYAYAFTGSPDLSALHPRFTLSGALPVILFVAVVITIGGSRAAGRAAHTPPIQSLREASLPARRMTPARWLTGSLAVAIIAAITASLPGSTSPAVPLTLIAPLTAGVLVSFGPLFLPGFVRAWTSVLPPTASAAWYLARNATATRGGATIGPLVVAVALAGGLFAADGASSQGSSTLTTGAVVLLIGGPLLLAVLGSVATIFMSSRRREREFALLVAAGGTPGLILLAAASEAVIYVGTALLLGLFSVAVTSVVGAWATHAWSWAGVMPSLTVAVASLLLVLTATVLPAYAGLRQRVTRVLAAE